MKRRARCGRVSTALVHNFAQRAAQTHEKCRCHRANTQLVRYAHESYRGASLKHRPLVAVHPIAVIRNSLTYATTSAAH